ncbi:MAG: ABC transporter permease [Chloroflexi bacterium]|nr:ABC transporter permease [Chloroflexota bacterium]
MTRYILRRLLLSIPVLLGIVLVVFFLARVIPGDPCRASLGEHATDQICDAFNVRFGLDKAIIPGIYKTRGGFDLIPADIPATLLDNQFVAYLGRVVTGDLGDSIKYGRPVTTLLAERLPLTIELALYALLFATLVGVSLGIISAIRRNSPVDVGTMALANLGVSIPVFVLGLVLQYVFAVVLRGTPFALPPSGRLTAGVQATPLAEAWGLEWLGGPLRGLLDFVSNIYTFNFLVTLRFDLLGDAIVHMILPAIALGTISLAIIARITRSSLLEVLGLDYTRTARAKGLAERTVVRRHALRNAMLPVVTIVGLQLGTLLGGAVLTESIFNLTGVGRTLFEAITGRDYVVIQAFTLIIAVGFVVVNLVVDVSYAWLDPRIRYS